MAFSDDDKVQLTRIWLGDTDKARQIYDAGDIELVLRVRPSPVQAAAALAHSRLAAVTRKVDKSIGRTRIALSQEAKALHDLIDRLERAGDGDAPKGPMSGVGGIRSSGALISEHKAVDEDESLRDFPFDVGRDDHPGIFGFDDEHEEG